MAVPGHTWGSRLLAGKKLGNWGVGAKHPLGSRGEAPGQGIRGTKPS